MSRRPRLPEVVIGTINGIDDAGVPRIDYPGNPAGAPVPALTTALCDGIAVGREVALLFVGGDPARPLIIGPISRPGQPDAPTNAATDAPTDNPPARPEVHLDGERLVLRALHEIVLECGRASITLTRAGKILIRGAYLLSRSSGVNRIKGGSVQIN